LKRRKTSRKNLDSNNFSEKLSKDLKRVQVNHRLAEGEKEMSQRMFQVFFVNFPEEK